MEVIIREVALRDGLQSEKKFVATKDKLALVDALFRAGVTYLETTSFVSPAAVPQLRDAAELMAEVPHGKLRHEVMVPNPRGARSALDAGVDRLIVFVSASEAHNKENVGRSISESLDGIDRIFELAAGSGVPVAAAIATAFGCPFQGKVPESDVVSIASRLAKSGADRITLADTTGMANPVHISEMTGLIRHSLPDTALCLHLHNNRGIAAANLYAGYLAGIRMFDTSLGGIGGCPNVPQAAGNLATEDVVFMFDSMGIDTGMELSALISAARLLEKILGHPLPGQVMKSGPVAGCS
ncbi:MAG: hydroxymethylglutaryl-CoA lyase [Desulfosalsimonas sp.]